MLSDQERAGISALDRSPQISIVANTISWAGLMVHHLGSVAALAVAVLSVAARGATPETSNPPPILEATSEKQIPCDVKAHSMGSVLSAMMGERAPTNCDKGVDISKVDVDHLSAIMPGEHPAHYYLLAARLFEADRKDESVFWFYAGQLRYRIRLTCHPKLAKDVEPALFGSLQQTVGVTINEYAGGNPIKWAEAMQKALLWDAATPNGFEPKAQCKSAISEQRGGFEGLIKTVRESAEEIRSTREKNGLSNN